MFELPGNGFLQRNPQVLPRLIFGDIAELYDQYRVGYPPEIAEWVFGPNATDLDVLEIGPGTGKATKWLLDHSRFVECFEPTPEMAAVLVRRLGTEKLIVWNEQFENARLEQKYHRVVAAESWQWLDSSIALAKAHDCLLPGGRLVLLFNERVHANRRLHDELTAMHDKLDTKTPRLKPGVSRSDLAYREVEQSPLFRDAARSSIKRTIVMTSDEYVGMTAALSTMRDLPPETRSSILVATRELVDAFGGSATLHYTTRLISASRNN